MSAQVMTALDQALAYAKQAEDTAFQRAKGTAESNAEALAKQLYTQKMVQQKTLPNVMQNAGLSTQGYTETTANAIGSNYQNNWNQAMMQRNDQIAGAQSQKDIATANLQSKYQTDLANYYTSKESAQTNFDNTLKLEDIRTKNDLWLYQEKARMAFEQSQKEMAMNPKSPSNPKSPGSPGAKQESLDVVTKQAGMYLVNGKLDEKGLTEYLQSMINNKSLTVEQAEALYNEIAKKVGSLPNPTNPTTPINTMKPGGIKNPPGTSGGSSWTTNTKPTTLTGGGKGTTDRNQQAIW